MSQNEHYIISFILGLVTWYFFWSPLFLQLTTKREWEYWDNKVSDWISKLF